MKIGMSLTRLFIGCFFIVSFSTSCTKKEAKPSITLDFSSTVGAQNTNQINTIIVNLTTPGGLQVFEYDCEREPCGQIEFEALAQGNALIQILVVIDDASHVTRVNYGDVAASLNGGDNFFDIPVSEIGNFVNEARISGRYIPSPGHGLAGSLLTGDMVMKVRPATGRPMMSLIRREIFGGWFRSFATDNIGFKYYFTGFDQAGNFYSDYQIMDDLHGPEGLQMNSSGLGPNANIRAHYFLPTQIYKERDGVYQPDNFEAKIVGFFGDVSSGRYLCADSLAAGTVLNGGSGTSEVCKSASGNTCSSFYTWGEIGVGGSVNGNSNTCTGSNPNEFVVDLEDVGEGDDSMVGFFGPFVANEAAGFEDPFDVDDSANFSWRMGTGVYLPAGFELFLKNSGPKVSREEVEDRDDGIFCDLLPGLGFQSFGVYSGATGSVSLAGFGVTQNSQLAICPRRPGGGYYSSAIFEGESDHSSEPTRIRMFKAEAIDEFMGKIYSGICVPMKVHLEDNSGELREPSSAIGIQLTDGPANGLFYNDYGSCIAGPGNEIPGQVLSMDYRNHTVYYKMTEGSGTALNLVASDTAGNLESSNFNMTSTSNQTISKIELVADYQRALEIEAASTEFCVPFNIVAKSSENVLTTFGGTKSFDPSGLYFNDGSTPFLVYDTEANCHAGPGNEITSPYTLPSADSEFQIWVDLSPAIGGGLTGDTDDILATCAGGMACGSEAINVVDPNGFDHWHVDEYDTGLPTGEAGHCYKFMVGAYDDHQPNSYPTFFPNAVPEIVPLVESGNTKGTFYDSTAICNAGVPMLFSARSLSLDNTITHESFYYRPHDIGTMNISLTAFGETKAIQETVNPPSGRAYLKLDDSNFWDFPDTTNSTTSAALSFTVTNVGDTAASTISPGSFLSVEFDYESAAYPGTGSCTAGLAAAGTCNVTLEFSPPSAVYYEDVVELNYFDGGAATSSRRVIRGQGL